MHSKRKEIKGDWRLYLAVNDAAPELFKLGSTNNIFNRNQTLTSDRPYGRHQLKPHAHVPEDFHRRGRPLPKLTKNDIVKDANEVRWGILRSFSSPRKPTGFWQEGSCKRVESALHVAFETAGLKVCTAASNQANPVRCVELFRVEKETVIQALGWLQLEAQRLRIFGAKTSKIGKYGNYTLSDLKFIERLARRLERTMARAT